LFLVEGVIKDVVDFPGVASIVFFLLSDPFVVFLADFSTRGVLFFEVTLFLIGEARITSCSVCFGFSNSFIFTLFASMKFLRMECFWTSTLSGNLVLVR